jgi:predicted acylesterase/phospholipase RssA
MTSAVPVLFTPVCMNGKCYVDGGIVNNYPINYCLKDHPEVDDILAFKNVYNNLTYNVGDESSVVDVIVSICQNLLIRMNSLNVVDVDIPNVIKQPSEVLSAEYFQQTLESEIYRRELIDDGIKTALEFIKKPSKTEEENPR